jgi:hypothetical protein
VLHEVLQQYPELIPTVLPWLWARRYSQEVQGHKVYDKDKDAISLPKLMRAIRILASQTNIPIKLCLFVDGLDEYDGDPNL